MDIRPAAFVAAAAIAAGAAGIGAYLAVRDNAAPATGDESDARLAMAATNGILLMNRSTISGGPELFIMLDWKLIIIDGNGGAPNSSGCSELSSEKTVP